MKLKIPLIRQLSMADCGAACLAMLFRYYGVKANVHQIAESINVGRDGITLRDMKDACDQFGFSFKAYKDYLNEENIKRNLPLIMGTKDNHYIVVTGEKNGIYYINDPAKGREEKNFEDLKNQCEKFIVLVKKQETCQFKQKENNRVSLKDVEPYKIIGTLMLTLFTQCIILLPSQVIQIMIDRGSYDAQPSFFYFITAVIIFIIYFLFNLLKQNIILFIQNNHYKKTAHEMVSKLFKINTKFYETHTSGDLHFRFNGINDIYDFILNILISMIIEVITAIACGIAMCRQSLVLFVVTIIIIGTQMLYINIIKKKLDDLTKNYIAGKSELEGKLVDVLFNIQQIRCMHLDNVLNKDLSKKYDDVLSNLKKKSKKENLLTSGVGAITLITPLVIYTLGMHFVIINEMTMGQLVSFVTLSTYFTLPFNTVSIVVPQIQGIREVKDRINEFLNFSEYRVSGDIQVNNFQSLSIADVSYAYGSKEKNISNVSLEVKKGQRIAIVGSSGSGKSTLIKVIMNVLHDYDGQVTINNIDISKIRNVDVDRIFTIVTQTPVALSGTIRENIDIFGSLSESEMNHAIATSVLGEFVSSLPMGVNTFVGENGQNISGGQKQRVAIARAVAQKPELIIFDEATSNLDSITERKIYENIENLGIAQVVVTHRLNTIKEFDCIYVMERGRIVEQGTYEGLMKKQGLFFRMVGAME